MRKAKIVATIGPASAEPATLRALMLAGLDVARVNMSHGTQAGHRESISRIRQAAVETERNVAVLLDLSGPKIRTGRLRGGQAQLVDGAPVELVPAEIEGSAERFSVNYPALADEIRVDDRILIGDGEIELKVVGRSPGLVTATVVQGGTLGEHKGLNFPGARLSVESVTPKDVSDLAFGIENGVDLIALSFVRSASDCRTARELIRKNGGRARLIAKIEKPEAVDDLCGILAESDGVMVARGDLAVETSPEAVPLLQKKIIADAMAAQKIVITATQMLQSMTDNPRPTRAEASDVANAVLDGSDALMLSAETAVGHFPVEAVRMMSRIIESTESPRVPIPFTPPAALGASTCARRQSGSTDRALAEAARFAAEEIDARLIVVLTVSGHMGRAVAALRPQQRIIALTTQLLTCRQLSLSWGVEARLLGEFPPGAEQVLALADSALLKEELAGHGESVVFIAGHMRDSALSDSVKIHRVG